MAKKSKRINLYASESNMINKKDYEFLEEKLKTMTPANFLKTCINTQRKLENNELSLKSDTSNIDLSKSIGEILEEKIKELIDKGYISSNTNKEDNSDKDNVKDDEDLQEVYQGLDELFGEE